MPAALMRCLELCAVSSESPMLQFGAGSGTYATELHLKILFSPMVAGYCLCICCRICWSLNPGDCCTANLCSFPEVHREHQRLLTLAAVSRLSRTPRPLSCACRQLTQNG